MSRPFVDFFADPSRCNREVAPLAAITVSFGTNLPGTLIFLFTERLLEKLRRQ